MNHQQAKHMLNYCILIEPLINTHNSLKQVFAEIDENSEEYMIASYIVRTMRLENTHIANEELINFNVCVYAYQSRKNVINFRYQLEDLITGFKSLLNYLKEFQDDPYHVCGVLLNEKISQVNDKCSGAFWKCYQDYEFDRFDLMDDGLWYDTHAMAVVESTLAALECFVRITNAKKKKVSIHLIIRDIAKTTLADFFKQVGSQDKAMEKISIKPLTITSHNVG